MIPCSCSTCPTSILPTDGAARFRNTNTGGSTPNEPMSKKGTRPRTTDAAEGSVMVNAPIGVVYKRWLAFEDYPKFVTAIKRVRKLDANHFVASLGLNGKEYDTTLEMMPPVPPSLPSLGNFRPLRQSGARGVRAAPAKTHPAAQRTGSPERCRR